MGYKLCVSCVFAKTWKDVCGKSGAFEKCPNSGHLVVSGVRNLDTCLSGEVLVLKILSG